jgi:hypothetical protein
MKPNLNQLMGPFQNPVGAEVTRLKLKRNQSLLTSAATVMKLLLGGLTLALTAGLSVPILRAQDRTTDNPNLNWFSFGPQFGLNIKARFIHVGYVNPASPWPPTTGGVDRTYNDGFVHVDNSGDAGGQTWNWGYQNASQVQGNMLMMHRTSDTAHGIGTLDQNDDPHVGFDLAFGRNLGTVPGGKWGLQAAFDFTDVSIHGNHPLTGTGMLISDAFSLGGVVPPQAPYAGSFNGPGPLLGDTPTETTTPYAVPIKGQRTLDAQIYALRAGPYYEFFFSKRWSGRLGGGLALALADTKYSFNETITFAGGEGVNNAGSKSGVEFQAGGYLEGKLLFALTRHTGLFAGAQYEYLGTFSRNAGNEQAQLDMSSAVYLLFGVQLRF